MLPSRVLFIFLLGILILLSSCDLIKVGPDPDPKPLAEMDKLPPATQSGKNTFGCLVNGMAWVSRTSLDAIATSQLQDFLEIGANYKDQALIFRIQDTLLGIGIYNLTHLPNYSVTLINYLIEPNCEYKIESTKSGKLKITKFDRANFVISGEFEFKTEAHDCESLEITDGRFDLTLIQ